MLAAGFLIVFGIQYVFFPTPDGSQFSLDAAQGALLTGFVVVATVNAVNFVDGLDGLAAGVVGIGAVAFFVFCYQLTNLNDASLATTGALLSVALAGACAGFLPHNFHPARLFMGDSGSMLIGLVLSASAVTLTGQFSGTEISQGASGLARRACCRRCCRCCCRSRSWSSRCSTWSSPSYDEPAPGARRSPRTSSTCTTGCSRSATRSGGRC